MNKVKKLAKNEIRAFKIKGNAISELLWELLNKYGSGFLDIPDDDFDNIFHLKWDRTRDQLIFYSVEFECPHPVDFEAIDRYIEENVDITTNSLFNPCNKRYVSFTIKNTKPLSIQDKK